MCCTPNKYKISKKERCVVHQINMCCTPKKYKISKNERCVVHQMNPRLVRKQQQNRKHR